MAASTSPSRDDLAIDGAELEPGIVIGKGVLDLLELEKPPVRKVKSRQAQTIFPARVSQHRLVNGMPKSSKICDPRYSETGL